MTWLGLAVGAFICVSIARVYIVRIDAWEIAITLNSIAQPPRVPLRSDIAS